MQIGYMPGVTGCRMFTELYHTVQFCETVDGDTESKLYRMQVWVCILHYLSPESE